MTYDWKNLHVLVAGLGVAGYPSATGLLHMGSRVTVVDDRPRDAVSEKAMILETLGAVLRLGPGTTSTPSDLLQGIDLLVTSPGFPPTTPLHVATREAGIPIIGEIDLGFALRPAGQPWIGITGTNGKTTTVEMLASILRAEGLRADAVGNNGISVVDTVLDPEPYDVLAVELSSHQLYWSPGLQLRAAAVLNVEDDHLEWHGSARAYAETKGKIYQDCEIACVYNVADATTEQLVRDADVVEGCRAIGFTTGIPAPGMIGVVDGVLADRAFVSQLQTSAAELTTLDDLPSLAPHNVANAAAAAALARAHGVSATAVRQGLRDFRIGGHRIERVAQIDRVTYVDDSKATNAHAARASLQAYDRVVWIAGGQAKGQQYDDLVRTVGDRLRAAVLLGVDRAVIHDALRRHAPNVPVIEEPGTDTEVMDRVVAAAARAAEPGDTVLLAPGCASRDMYTDYAERGEAFVSAVQRYGHRDHDGRDDRTDQH